LLFGAVPRLREVFINKGEKFSNIKKDARLSGKNGSKMFQHESLFAVLFMP
jgi:hypothetical protein